MRSPHSALSPDGRTCVSGARRLAHLLLPLLLATAFPAPAAETLADAWRAALAVDGRLRAADADSDAARASLEAARGLALPKATASSSYTVLSKEPAARIGLRITLDSPGRSARKISCPIMFCVCDTDSVAPARATERHARKAPRGEIKHYPFGHFDIYVGGGFERAVRDQIDFLERHVPIGQPPAPTDT